MDKENSVLRNKIQTTENLRIKAVKDLEKSQEELFKLYRNADEYRSNKLENQTNKALLERKVT